MNDAECLDPAALERLRQLGQGKFLIEMIDLYLSWSAKKIEQARAGETAGDITAIEQGVHSLKSSAANIGAVQVRDLAARIENLAREKQMNAVIPLLPELYAAAEQAALRLTEIRKQSSA